MKRFAVVLALAFLVATLAQTSSSAWQKPRVATPARQANEARTARSAEQSQRAREDRDEDAEEAFSENCQRQYEYSMTNYSSRLVAEEKQTLSRASVQVLDVEGSRNGGVSIRGWDQPNILIKACKLVGADDDATAQAVLNQLTISTEGGKVRARGPEGTMSDRRVSWNVQLSIFVPRDLAIEASVHNGGLALRNLNGQVTGRAQNGGISISKSGSTQFPIELHAVNGGISLNNVEGKVNAHTNNGGITLSRGSGEVKLESQNGGIVVRLPEGGWAGESLEARTQNGGLILHVPEGFNSGIEAETSAYSRIECRVPGCPQDQSESEGRSKRVQLGGSSSVVHVSTRNGSLQIMPAK